MAQPQPAKVSYFFGKGYSDLWNTIKESWSRNIHSAGDQFSLACEKGCFTMGGGMNLIAAISIFTFGSLITAFTTFAHIAVLFAFFAFIYMGFGLLWLIDRIYIMINKIKNACPNPDCQASFLIPTYECPGCGEKHTNLVPSKYGILKRTCLCGTKLPTTFLNGRGQLKAYCPECDTALSGDTASRQKKEELTERMGREPTMEELATSLGTEKEELVQAMEAATEVESIYRPIHQEGDSQLSILDRLEEKSRPEEHLLNRMMLSQILDGLDKEERQLIYLRYFQEKTQAAVGEILGISQVQVSRMEKKILERMRKQM